MEKLGLTEFTEVFYSNLDTLIISSIPHVEDNEDFYDEVVFKCFDIYQREGSNYTINEILRFFHVFLYSMFKHSPSKKDENVINLS